MKKSGYFFLLLSFGIFLSLTSCARDTNELDKNQKIDKTELQKYEKATLAGGCFWCVEAVFERVAGVKEVISGYTGGKEKNPSYEAVASGKTSHAEAVEVYFDPEVISFKTILEIFFATHDPTTLNRQGPDVGKQYRSAIFYHNDSQKLDAQKVIAQLEQEGKFKDPIVTLVEAYTEFYDAEAYHQDYYEHNPRNPYIINVTRPKIVKFEKEYKEYLKEPYKK